MKWQSLSSCHPSAADEPGIGKNASCTMGDRKILFTGCSYTHNDTAIASIPKDFMSVLMTIVDM